MNYITLGKTNLKVSELGLGCGGPSRIGQRTGKTKEQSIDLIRHAIKMGINILDTAEIYRTEKLVGKAIQPFKRETLVISTKKNPYYNFTANGIKKGIKNSLKRLKTDYIDIYNFHAVRLNQYDYIVTELLPIVQEFKDEGIIKHIGITEEFSKDLTHKMVKTALEDDYWDVMMVGYNMINQSADKEILPKIKEKNIGSLIMYAVRRALSNQTDLEKTISSLVKKGHFTSESLDLLSPYIKSNKLGNILDFLLDNENISSIPDAAYKFCRDNPNTNVILSGTGSIEHLNENIKAIEGPKLSESETLKIKKIFEGIDSVGG